MKVLDPDSSTLKRSPQYNCFQLFIQDLRMYQISENRHHHQSINDLFRDLPNFYRNMNVALKLLPPYPTPDLQG